MDYIALGRQIRLNRKRRNLSQEALASLADISASFMGHIERGTRKASLETILSIANALQCDLDNLFAGQLRAAGENDRLQVFLASVTMALREYEQES